MRPLRGLGEQFFCEQHEGQRGEHEAGEPFGGFSQPFAEAIAQPEPELCEDECLEGDQPDYKRGREP